MASDVAILCSGPSLGRFLERYSRRADCPHEVVVGVNRAAVAFPCDWWAFNDAETFDRNRVKGRPRCFTSNEAFARIGFKQLADRYEWTFYAQIATTCPASPGWTSFSLTVAMVLSEWLLSQGGPSKAVTLYGVDQFGVDDWDGPSPVPVIRTDERWNRELHHFGHVLEWLRSRGVNVIPQPKEAVGGCAV